MTLFVFMLLVTIPAIKSNSATKYLKQYSTYFDLANGTLNGIAKFHVPYIVSIQSTQMTEYKHLCAGTIIDESFVLTAAHCFNKVNNPTDLSIAAGSNILAAKATKGIRHRVLKIIPYENYIPLHEPDIALLKVKPKFKLDNKHIGKININTNSSFNETKTYMIGWGRTKKNTNIKLQLVSFSIIDSNTCKNQGFKYVTKTEICAISHKGRGACDGDSGGPLVNTAFNKQIGIISYGRKPCMRGHIYAFTKLSSQSDWIMRKIKKFS